MKLDNVGFHYIWVFIILFCIHISMFETIKLLFDWVGRGELIFFFKWDKSSQKSNEGTRRMGWKL